MVLEAARTRKERRYQELVGPRSRARLVVLAVEVGGRWSPASRSFLAQFAKASLVRKHLSFKNVPSKLGGGQGLTETPLLVLRWWETIVTMVWCE